MNGSTYSSSLIGFSIGLVKVFEEVPFASHSNLSIDRVTDFLPLLFGEEFAVRFYLLIEVCDSFP